MRIYAKVFLILKILLNIFHINISVKQFFIRETLIGYTNLVFIYSYAFVLDNEESI